MILQILYNHEVNWIDVIFILKEETTAVVVYKYLNA